jgi:hypothetical protein
MSAVLRLPLLPHRAVAWPEARLKARPYGERTRLVFGGGVRLATVRGALARSYAELLKGRPVWIFDVRGVNARVEAARGRLVDPRGRGLTEPSRGRRHGGGA